MSEQRVNAASFNVCKKLSKIIGYHSSVLGLLQTFVNIMIPIHTSTNGEILVKIDQYLLGYANFCPVLCAGVAKISIFALVISEVTEPMFTIFLHVNVNACISAEDIAIRCGMTEQRVNVVNADICKRLPQLTGYTSTSLGQSENKCHFRNYH